MKVAVVNNTVPFLRGGAEVLADALVDQLQRAGHEAMLVKLPFSWQPVEHIADGMLAASLTTLSGADRVIGLKFPAYLVPHGNKSIWLLHQFRQFYELWDTPHRGYDKSKTVESVRTMVHSADTRCFSTCRHLFTNSAVTANRLKDFNDIRAEVLHPPLPDPDAFFDAGTGDFIFAGGRINGFKRQLLAVQAMKHVHTDVRLVVAGLPETDADLSALLEAREESGRPDRIHIVPQYISERHKIELVNTALGIVYCPIDEDSYGYVTLEGAQASKPLITTTDSGGITDLVHDGRSGFVCPPDPRALAEAFDALHRSPSLAAKLGRGAHDRALELGISWSHVLSKLLA